MSKDKEQKNIERFDDQYTVSHFEQWKPRMEITPSMIRGFIKQSYISFLENEIERLEEKKISLFGMNSDKDMLEYGGYNQALQEIIDDDKQVIKEIR